MSKRKSSETNIVIQRVDTLEDDDATENELVFVPNNGNDSDVEELDSDSENNNVLLSEASANSYKRIYEKYDPNAKKLKESHEYRWVDDDKKYDPSPRLDMFSINEIKTQMTGKEPVEYFEMFFSKEMKDYILEATAENELEIDHEKLDNFVGIAIFSIFNARKSYRDYWSKDDMLHSDTVSNIMSRNEFETIKSKLKTSKISDKNEHDKIWKVRALLNIFRRNIQQFGFFPLQWQLMR